MFLYIDRLKTIEIINFQISVHQRLHYLKITKLIGNSRMFSLQIQFLFLDFLLIIQGRLTYTGAKNEL